MPLLQIKLTPSGRKRLGLLEEAIAGIAEQMLREGVEATIKPEVVSRTPNPREEERMLSRGKIEGRGALEFDPASLSAVPRFGEVGTSAGGRFIKSGYSIHVKNAVAADVVVTLKTEGMVTAKFGNTKSINQKTGFAWMTAGGIMRNTYPFNHQLIQSMEYGGTWIVRPRTNKYLSPEPGVTAERMRKTLPPIGMFKKGGMAGIGKLRKYLETRITETAKRI